MTKQNQYFPQTVLHPSVTLTEKLEELGMGPKEFAIRTGKPEKTITAILKGESAVTPDMAVLFENVLRIPAHFWLNKQRNFDEYTAREKRVSALTEAVGWAKLKIWLSKHGYLRLRPGKKKRGSCFRFLVSPTISHGKIITSSNN